MSGRAATGAVRERVARPPRRSPPLATLPERRDDLAFPRDASAGAEVVLGVQFPGPVECRDRTVECLAGRLVFAVGERRFGPFAVFDRRPEAAFRRRDVRPDGTAPFIRSWSWGWQ
ncbi:MAG: hypothetical protein V5A44_02170 [Haloarculaceae archaeon]